MDAIRTFITEHILAYGTFAAIGLVAAFAAAVILCFKMKQNWVRQIPLMLLSLVGLIAGAKLFGMISYERYLRSVGIQDITIKRLFNDSGIVFYGGLLGYFGMMWLLFWKLLPKKRLAWDIVAVSTPLFHGFARIGCYFGHEMVDGQLVWRPCCYGIHMENAFCSHFWDSRFPTQLFESGFNFLLFGILLALLLTDHEEKRRGSLIRIYLIAYAVFRFIIEFFRGDEVRGAYGIFSFSQVVSLFILFGVMLAWILKKKKIVKPLPPDPFDPEVERYDLFIKPETVSEEETEDEKGFTEGKSMDSCSDKQTEDNQI